MNCYADQNEYQSVITEQGDLGLGVTDINDFSNKNNEEKQKDKHKDK